MLGRVFYKKGVLFMSGLAICVLASGSAGNSIYLATDSTQLLVDAGLSGRETTARLSSLGTTKKSLKGICLTHEHSDHITGLKPLQNLHHAPIFANAGTAEAVRADPNLRRLEWQIFENGSPFHIGNIRVEAFSVPHDAADPVGYVFEAGGIRVAVALDFGLPTTLIKRRLRECRALVLESNHDTGMLGESDRPWSLKQRILGRQGHLSNQTAAELLAEVAGPSLTDVFLGHLSQECNRPDIALAAANDSLKNAGFSQVRVHPTFPDQISEIVLLRPSETGQMPA